MSVEKALAFLEYVQSRDALQHRIGQLKGAGALRDLSAIAAGEGFEFSEQEYREAVSITADNELSDEAIERFARENRLMP